MKKGEKVKTEIIDGIWFVGTYTDDYPDSESIVVNNKKMAMIIPKSECVSAERPNEASGLHLHSVIKSSADAAELRKIALKQGIDCINNDFL